jgi:hypothetical protein
MKMKTVVSMVGCALVLLAVMAAAPHPAAGTLLSPAIGAAALAAAVPSQTDGQALEAQGYERILRQRRNGSFSKAGWNHYGPGYFELDEQTGVLASHGGMGLMWYAVEEYGDFVLELDFMTEVENANSGVFVRVPGMPSSDEYIYHSWEIQIHDTSEGIHQTGGVYDAEAPSHLASKGPGEWNHFKITFVGNRITVELNGETVTDWEAEPRGKVLDFAPRGYIGLQNHDRDTRTFFRDIFVKRLD